MFAGFDDGLQSENPAGAALEIPEGYELRKKV
jgi:hypothetical protein